jgi:N-acetyl-alpha-D-glucosaminyl L-malate synthase BshA
MSDRKLKVGVTCYPSWGGSGIVATELGISIAERGHDVHFITQSMPIRLKKYMDRIFFHEVDTHDYPVFVHTPYTVSLAAKMSEVASYYKLDLLHVHYAIPHAVAAFLARQMVSEVQLKSVVTLHGTDITLVGIEPAFYKVTKFAIENADAVTAVSEFLSYTTKDSFHTGANIEVIPNFVDTERFSRIGNEETRKHFAPNCEKVLAHASNFRPVKNIKTVIEVFDRVRRQKPACLLMIGDGPERAVAENLVRSLGIEGQVKFLGIQENMEELLSIADIFLLPSEHEGFGLSALEAMSTETAVVATNVGGLSEVIEQGVSGYLTDPSDLEGMTSIVAELLVDDKLRKEIGKRARDTVLRGFTKEKIVKRYEDLYLRVCGEGQ